MRRRTYTAIVCCLVLSGSTGFALAADESEYTPPLSLSVNLLTAGEPTGDKASVARDTTLRLRLFGIYSDADGTFAFGDSIPLATRTIDFEQTLGLDMNGFNGGAMIGLNFGGDKRWHFELGFNGYYDYDGTKDVGSISFNDKVFTAEVDSNLKIIETFAGISYDVWMSDARNLTLNTGLDLHLFYVQTSLQEVLGVQRDEKALWAPVPALSVALRWDITRNLYVRGRAAGIWMGDLGDYYELGAEVGYDFNRHVGVFMGCSYWDLRFDYSDTELDYDAGRLYAGVEVRI